MKELEKLFVPYKIAKQLSKRGFNKPCFGYYLECLERETNKTIFPLLCEGVRPMLQEKLPDNLTNAPLYQQVIDWFREHNIGIQWNIYNGYTGHINYIRGSKWEHIETKEYQNFYNMLNASIQEALKFEI